VYGGGTRRVQRVHVHVVLGQQKFNAAHGSGLDGAVERGGFEFATAFDQRAHRVHGIGERGEMQRRHFVDPDVRVTAAIQQRPQAADATVQGAYVHGAVAAKW